MNMGSDWSDPCDCPEGTVNRRGECVSLVSDVNFPNWEHFGPVIEKQHNITNVELLKQRCKQLEVDLSMRDKESNKVEYQCVRVPGKQYGYHDTVIVEVKVNKKAIIRKERIIHTKETETIVNEFDITEELLAGEVLRDLFTFGVTSLQNHNKSKPLDTEFLSWLYHRMIYIHKEDKNADYMIKLRNIVNDEI